MSAKSRCEAEAADWVARRDAGLDEAGRRELACWLAADSAHRTAFEDCASAWSALDRPRRLGWSVHVEQGLRQRAQRRQRRRRVLGVGLAAAMVVAALMWQRPAPSSPASIAVASATTTARILPDGSRAELNRGAEIEADFGGSERRVRLLRGESHFEVRPDQAHPFVVEVGGVEVRAVGTAFAIHYVDGKVEVLVTEGRVAVLRRVGEGEVAPTPDLPAADAAPLLLSVGQRATLPAQPASLATAVEEMTDEDYAGRLGWRDAHLEFSGTPLVEVVKHFNLHNRQKLVIGDPALAALQVSGIFRGNNVEGFTRLLEGSFGVRPEVGDNREIVLRRAP